MYVMNNKQINSEGNEYMYFVIPVVKFADCVTKNSHIAAINVCWFSLI